MSRPSPTGRRGGSPLRVWVFIAALASAAVVVLHFGVHAHRAGVWDNPLEWLVMAAGFAIAEACVVHVNVGRHAHTFALADIPLVAGLFLLAPLPLVAARLTGALIALVVVRRQPPVKLAFNLAQLALGLAAALAVWTSIGETDPASQGTWLAALAGILTVAVVSGLAVNGVMFLAGGRPGLAQSGRTLAAGVVTGAGNTGFVLMSAAVVRTDWRGIWAVVLLAGFLTVAQRSHLRLQKRHGALERLNGAARRLGRDLQADSIAQEIVTGAAAALNVATARLELLANGDRPAVVLSFDGQSVTTTETTDAALVREGDSDNRRRTERITAQLQAHGKVLGYLSVTGSALVPTFGEDEQHLLNTLAQHASTTLTNGRLADQLRLQVADNEHQATHDSLTGLANRLMFERVVDAMLGSNRRLAVLLFDLDRFKEVNDTLGHAAGDALLRDVGERLRLAVPQALCIARLGGDEFTVLLTNADASAASAAAQSAREALLNPLELNCVPVSVDASIGIAMAPEHGDSCDDLLRHADVAMYAAKDGRRGVVVYDPAFDDNDASRLGMVAELRDAIQNDQLFLHYQPKVSLADATDSDKASVEALVRWNHPVRGFVPPDDFIGVAEQTGVIVALTDWVLTRALIECRRWLDSGLDMSIAVNISPRVLRDVTFPERLVEMLAAHRVPAARLTLEITESAIMDDVQHAVDVLWQLRKAGVRLSIDDLGIGQSSLAYLKRLPVHEVKIDKSFVFNMADDQDDDAIVCAVVGLAHRLRLSVVAEGVETVHARDRLVEIGCDVAQGYWYSRPLAAADVAPWFSGRADLGRPLAPAEPAKPQLRVAQS
ncbi:MAG TPA: EAL domain-containing protein [Mycobacteriales bacterium]|jgi:diguanylate cyclase (GGDEF)-like protein|nr:EAL domain-containing protein [Mycobacteriales bacterium]